MTHFKYKILLQHCHWKSNIIELQKKKTVPNAQRGDQYFKTTQNNYYNI